MLVFQCPSCQAKLQASEKDAGKKIVCPKCQTKATVPEAEDDDDGITEKPGGKPAKSTGVTTPENARTSKADAREDDDDDDRPRKRGDSGAKKAGMSIGLILAIVGGVVACCVCVPGGLVVYFFGAAVTGVKGAAERVQTTNNMKQIALAEHNHNDAMRSLPAPCLATANLSWRYSILPYVEQNQMFAQMDPKQGWNSPANQPFANSMPNIYLSIPKQTPQERAQTHFQYFTGPNTLFPDPKTQVQLPRDIPDGMSNTILFADALTPVPWSKPADMAITPNGPLPLPPDRFMAAMADGSVRMIDRSKANDNVLRMLINPKDGQPIPPGVID